METTKPCRKCGTILPLTDFYPRTRSRDGCQHTCKHCMRARTAEWTTENRERKRANDSRKDAARAAMRRAWRAGFIAGSGADIPEGVRVLYVERGLRSGELNPNFGKTGHESPSWKGDKIGYRGAQSRVRRTRGPARDHRCVDCGERANHWSYAGGCPDEKIGASSAGNVKLYSPNPDRYVARCRECDRAYTAYACESV